MANTTATLRGLVAAAILADKTATNFTLNNTFAHEESYLPRDKRTTVPADGKVWLVALGKDDTIISRARSFQSEIGIEVAFHFAITDHEVATCDPLLLHAEELRKSVKEAAAESEIFAWLRNETLRDGNGLPYHFTGLRDRATFEAYFTAYFQVHEEG